MSRSLRRGWPLAAVFALAACGDTSPTATTDQASLDGPATALQALDCTADVASGTVSCAAPASSGARRTIIGGQNVYVRLTSSDVISEAGIGFFQMNVTVQNLLNEAIGTFDGVVVDPEGIKVFFAEGPTTTEGTGNVSVANADGTDLFMGSTQPYFRYAQMLDKDEVSAAKPWQFDVNSGVIRFAFKVYVQAEVQPLLVINEVLVNPGGLVGDSVGEWFEVYNAGTLAVNMHGMLLSDSANSGRRPYHTIADPQLKIAPGAYLVFGNSARTANTAGAGFDNSNGGVPVDYVYRRPHPTNVGQEITDLSFVNSTDAIKISRPLILGDTTSTLFTVDRTQYSSAGISAQNGVARELKNPALDNANMDGSNWADALVTAVYGPGGRGTPKAQNSTYTP